MKKQALPSGQTLADYAFEKNLKPRPEVSLSLFSFMFSEIVQQLMKQEKNVPAQGIGNPAGNGMQESHLQNDLEHQLYYLGVPVGEKLLELLFYREKGGISGACQNGKRETKLVNMLHFINNVMWKQLFGKPADGLEQSIEDEDEYRILDKNPVTNKFTSMGKVTNVNCSSYIAGIIEGVLSSCRMYCKVTAHLYSDNEDTGADSGANGGDGSAEGNSTTIYVIKFNKEVTAREKVRGGNRGGWDQFKWDDVRLMSYKDRECYLGASERLGYLDKGGKWRKRDWWVGTKADGSMTEEMRKEIERVKKEDEALMRQKLGLEAHKDVKQVLQEVQDDNDQQRLMLNKLTDYEMKELTAKNGMLPQHSNQGFENGAATELLTDQRETADRVGGLGFEQKLTMNKKLIELQRDAKNTKKNNQPDINQLEGIGIEDTKYFDQRKKLVMINYLKEKIDQQKREQKELKKAKKEERRKKKEEKRRDKKHGKKDRKKRWDSRSKSRSPSRSESSSKIQVEQIKSSTELKQQPKNNFKIIDDSDASSVRDPSEDYQSKRTQKAVSRSRSRSFTSKNVSEKQQVKEEIKQPQQIKSEDKREVKKRTRRDSRDRVDDKTRYHRDDRQNRDHRSRDRYRRDDRDRRDDNRDRRDDRERRDQRDRHSRDYDRNRMDKTKRKRSYSKSSKSSSSSFLSD
eukprot:403372774